jgi:hypothetical protein
MTTNVKLERVVEEPHCRDHGDYTGTSEFSPFGCESREYPKRSLHYLFRAGWRLIPPSLLGFEDLTASWMSACNSGIGCAISRKIDGQSFSEVVVGILTDVEADQPNFVAKDVFVSPLSYRRDAFFKKALRFWLDGWCRNPTSWCFWINEMSRLSTSQSRKRLWPIVTKISN